MKQCCFIIAVVERNAFPFEKSLEASDFPVSDVGLHLWKLRRLLYQGLRIPSFKEIIVQILV